MDDPQSHRLRALARKTHSHSQVSPLKLAILRALDRKFFVSKPPQYRRDFQNHRTNPYDFAQTGRGEQISPWVLRTNESLSRLCSTTAGSEPSGCVRTQIPKQSNFEPNPADSFL